MKSKHLLRGIVVLLLAVAARPLFAWDDEGHMMVAYVAYKQLTPAARDRANALIKLNPKYNDWVATLPAGVSLADKDMMTFMIAATWPDQIKHDPAYTSDGSHNGNHPEGSPDPTANTGYSDKLMHKYWHFIDQPFSSDSTALPAIPTPNAQERIALFRGVLGSTATDDLKSYDLVWLLHLVGDVHQPLHCATRVDRDDPNGDAGGNKVKLSCAGCQTELHAFWDDALGTSKKPKSAIIAGEKLHPADPVLAAKAGEADWVGESFEQAPQNVYVDPVAAGLGPFELSSQYKKSAKTLAQQRVALAGARLANLLNNELE